MPQRLLSFMFIYDTRSDRSFFEVAFFSSELEIWVYRIPGICSLSSRLSFMNYGQSFIACVSRL